MQRIQLDKDILPLSEFRANVASCIEEVRKTKRPIVITQHGKSAAVMIDVSEYEALMEKLEILTDIHVAETQIQSGNGIEHSEVKKQIRAKITK
jgi:antitoxin YefM